MPMTSFSLYLLSLEKAHAGSPFSINFKGFKKLKNGLKRQKFYQVSKILRSPPSLAFAFPTFPFPFLKNKDHQSGKSGGENRMAVENFKICI